MKKLIKLLLSMTLTLLFVLFFSSSNTKAANEGAAPLKDLGANQVVDKSVSGLQKIDDLKSLSNDPTIPAFNKSIEELRKQRTSVDANWNYDAVIVNYETGFGVNMLNSKGQYLNQYVPHGSAWRSNGVQLINGKRSVLIGNDAYVPEEYLDQYTVYENGWVTITQKTPQYKWEHTNGNGKPSISIVSSNYQGFHGLIIKSYYSSQKSKMPLFYYSLGNDQYINIDDPGVHFHGG